MPSPFTFPFINVANLRLEYSLLAHQFFTDNQQRVDFLLGREGLTFLRFLKMVRDVLAFVLIREKGHLKGCFRHLLSVTVHFQTGAVECAGCNGDGEGAGHDDAAKFCNGGHALGFD